MAKKVKPVHPGEILREEFMTPLGLSMNKMAMALRVPVTRIADIVNERRGITADTALRFARYFNNSPTFWMNLQTRYDLEVAEDEIAEIVELPCWHCFERADIAFNLISNLIFGDFQVIARLEIHPERRTIVKVARETQGCVSSNCAFLVDDIGDPRHRDAQVHSNSVHAESQREHKLFSENFSWMHRLKFL